MIVEKSWTFKVASKASSKEVVCIIGSCNELGNWDPNKVIPLTREENSEDSDEESSVWSITLQLPLKKVDYRYCITLPTLNSNPPIHIIRKWETHFKPRSIAATDSQDTEDIPISIFGELWGQSKIETGWLVNDCAVHLNLSASTCHGDPIIMWKKKHKDKQLRVKVTPIQLNATNGSTGEDTTELGDSRLQHLDSLWPSIEVAMLREGECKFRPQGQFGVLFEQSDFTMFECRTLNVDTTAFMFDFYVDEANSEIPLFIGSSYVLPSHMSNNYGVVTLPVSSQRHLPIGQLKVHYMVVKPLIHAQSNMSVSYSRYWNDSWKGLEVGHRGAGNSFHSEPKSCANIRENTVASLKYAAEIGADMVEIDVQLSRDLVPVIYHDFHACIALKRKKDQDHSDLLEIPIKDLTVQQLQALKDVSYLEDRVTGDTFSYCDQEDVLYHLLEKGSNKFGDDDLQDHQPFPTLEQALRSVPVSCGFNIEIKWTMLLADGKYELDHPFELNQFMDLILKVVLDHAGSRKIVFSSFHPDICTMLRLKQNIYPIVFLTQGITTLWPEYDDIRTKTTQTAVHFAKTTDILGINLHTEELLKEPSLMKSCLDNELIVFCWGEQNNDKNIIDFLKKLGMHAIVYDKIDVYNEKNEKESIFLCEERDALSESSGMSSATSLTSSEDNIPQAEQSRPQPMFTEHLSASEG